MGSLLYIMKSVFRGQRRENERVKREERRVE
jgi:hypothetical protein